MLYSLPKSSYNLLFLVVYYVHTVFFQSLYFLLIKLWTSLLIHGECWCWRSVDCFHWYIHLHSSQKSIFPLLAAVININCWSNTDRKLGKIITQTIEFSIFVIVKMPFSWSGFSNLKLKLKKYRIKHTEY